MSRIGPLRGLALTVAFAPALAGCAAHTGDGPWVELNGQRFTVEIADDDTERTRGLMFRDRLDADRGMLFIHDRQEPLAYWMMNTRIPLDILYFDAQRRLVSAQRRVPPCASGNRCPTYPSEGPALYVLELKAGSADRLDVKVGDELRFGPDIGTPP